MTRHQASIMLQASHPSSCSIMHECACGIHQPKRYGSRPSSPPGPHVRCFVALDLPVPVCNYLAGLRVHFGRMGQVRWVPAEQLHVTLLFAGELPEGQLPGLRAAVAAAPLPHLELHLTGLGHFPPRGEPRVLWAGLGGELAALAALHEHLAGVGEPLGVPRDDRPFTPHVTLGRVKSPFGAMALIRKCEEVGATLRPKPFRPVALSLYASELRPAGPVHTPLLQRKLPGPAS